MKCLEKEPSRRYSSAAELARDLERFQNHEPIEARAATAPERLLRWGKRNPAIAVSLAIVLLVLIVGLAASSWLAFQAQELASREHQLALLEHNARIKAEQAQGRGEEARKKEQQRADAETKARKELEAQKRATEKALAEAEQARTEAERAKHKAENLVYAFRIDEARQALERGKHDDVRQKLKLTEPKFQGWEYDFLLRQTMKRFTKERQQSKYTLDGKGISVTSVAFTTDGERLVVASRIKVVKVWNFAKKEVMQLEGHERLCCFSRVLT